jgi:hypothetical protein
MLFDYDLTIPAATAQASPASTIVKLTRGTLTRVDVLFPPGCASLVFVRVRDRLHQIVPANPEASLNWDGAIIRSDFELELVDSPYEIILEGWSPDAAYPHTVTFHFHLRPAGQDSWSDFFKLLFAPAPVSTEVT